MTQTMKRRTLKEIKTEAFAMAVGQIAPGRIWTLKKRADGTYERKLEDPKAYREERAKAIKEDIGEALKVRRKFGVSQREFARILGISVNTLQNWEQHRNEPAGAAAVLLRIAAKHPEIVKEAAGN